MVASYSDKQFLAADSTFQNRVRQSLLAACVSIKNEAVTTAFHRERENYLVAITNQPDFYKIIFTDIVANDANVISDATANGTVVLTSANAAAQAALVTDAHVDTAISSDFNSFFRTPGT